MSFLISSPYRNRVSYTQNSDWEVTVKHRELLVLRGNLEWWDGVGCGREAQKGGAVGILMADSHCCMAETNATLQSNYPPIKKKPIKLI